MLRHRPADGQVVAVPWKKSQPPSVILGLGALGWGDAQLSLGLIFVSGCWDNGTSFVLILLVGSS